jgi:hypothetical protein
LDQSFSGTGGGIEAEKIVVFVFLQASDFIFDRLQFWGLVIEANDTRRIAADETLRVQLVSERVVPASFE